MAKRKKNTPAKAESVAVNSINAYVKGHKWAIECIAMDTKPSGEEEIACANKTRKEWEQKYGMLIDSMKNTHTIKVTTKMCAMVIECIPNNQQVDTFIVFEIPYSLETLKTIGPSNYAHMNARQRLHAVHIAELTPPVVDYLAGRDRASIEDMQCKYFEIFHRTQAKLVDKFISCCCWEWEDDCDDDKE